MEKALQTRERAVPNPSPTYRSVLLIVITAGAAICFPAIKAALAFSPPLKFAALRTLIAGLALLAATALMRQPLWLPKRLARWIFSLYVMQLRLHRFFRV